MRMILQQGYGMMALNKEFSGKYNNIEVVLSPRALQSGQQPQRLKEHANEIKKNGGKILFDPQFYQPRTNLDKILNFPYFEQLDYKTTSFTGEEAKQFSKNVINFQKNTLGVDEYIIPGTFSNSFSEDWIQQQEDLMYGGLSSDIDGVFYQTISIGSDFVLDERFSDFIGFLVLSKVDGYYLTLRKPNEEPFVSNSVYLYNLLDAILSLKLSGKKIIIGYANPQDLMFASVGLDGIATGNYQNVRNFNPDMFFMDEEESIKRRSTWYYDNNTFSEFKPEQLALAQNRDKLHLFQPSNDYTAEYLGANPITSYLWNESMNFKNYLYSMYLNCNDISSSTKKFSFVESMFLEKEKNLKTLFENGIREGNRTFRADAFEATLSAFSAIKNDREEDIEELELLV